MTLVALRRHLTLAFGSFITCPAAILQSAYTHACMPDDMLYSASICMLNVNVDRA